MSPNDDHSGTDPIAELLERYSNAVAVRDAEMWGSTWCDDGVWELTAGVEISGREAIVAAWVEAMARYNDVEHRYEGHESRLDEPARTGTGRAFLRERVQPVDGSPPRQMSGYYDDTYRRTAAGWCFARRRLTRLVEAEGRDL